MNVNNQYGSIATSPLSSLSGIQAASPASPSSIPPAGPGAASASISGPAQFFSEMQQLAQQNPAEFQNVAGQVAASFKNAASQTSGPEAQLLSNLAARFSQASQTGSLSTPPGMQGTQAGAMGTASGQSTAAHTHHHRLGDGGSSSFLSQSSLVQSAFQNALSIVDQATQGASLMPSTSST